MPTKPNSYDSYQKSLFLSIKHSTYFHVYDRLFTPFVGKEITFVEVGVFHGGSLFMWRDFFGDTARIIGIDLNPGAKKWEEEGFEIFIGNQTDPKFWKQFFEEVGPIDIFLDDGGHTFEQQIVTTLCALPHINDGGLLVVEDTHTSYMKGFGGPSPLSFVNFAKNIVDGINYRFSKFRMEKDYEKLIHSIRFFESIVAFEIDRKLCDLESKPSSNGGKASDAKDFRYRDKVVVTASQLMKCFKY